MRADEQDSQARELVADLANEVEEAQIAPAIVNGTL
jgi:hypothetical protein